MKSYTDLEQSKKLAEILPLESADMCYRIVAYNPNDTHVYQPYCFSSTLESDIPCWSLAALLDVLESEIDGEEGETYQLNIEKDGTWWNVWYRERYDEANPIETASTEELIDACVEMIEKLHKQKLL
jgi:alpha-L-arabinofuranosidase